MRLVRQPRPSHLCGQACVAMIAGVDLKRAIKAVGHDKGTDRLEIAYALARLGIFGPFDKYYCRWRPPSDRCLLNVAYSGGRRHWVVRNGGWLYDPWSGRAAWKDRKKVVGRGRFIFWVSLAPLKDSK